MVSVILFFSDTATTVIYTLSLHDALPIYERRRRAADPVERGQRDVRPSGRQRVREAGVRSEEHTSELQSQSKLVCRLLLEKKKMFKFIKPVPRMEKSCFVMFNRSYRDAVL